MGQSRAGFDTAKMHGDTTGLNPLLLLLLPQRKKAPQWQFKYCRRNIQYMLYSLPGG
jgi:hypothetical protein